MSWLLVVVLYSVSIGVFEFAVAAECDGSSGDDYENCPSFQPVVQIIFPEDGSQLPPMDFIEVEYDVSFFDPENGYLEIEFQGRSMFFDSPAGGFVTLPGFSKSGDYTMTAVLHSFTRGQAAAARHQVHFNVDGNRPSDDQLPSSHILAGVDRWNRWPIPDKDIKKINGFPNLDRYTSRPLLFYAPGLEWAHVDNVTAGSAPLSFWYYHSDSPGISDAIVFNCVLPPITWVKPKHQIWIYFCVEARHEKIAKEARFSKVFDMSASYMLDATVPLLYLPPAASILWNFNNLTPIHNRPGLIAYIASNCGRPRDFFVAELMKHMQVDSYGKCLNNKAFPEDAPVIAGSKKLGILGSYKFVLAFENTMSLNYVTEKFYQPLMMGAIPVYMGAPDVQLFSPCDDCYIDIRNFTSPMHLAEHLRDLANDDAALNRMTAWRTNQLVKAGYKELCAFSMNSGIGSTEGTQHGNPGMLDTARISAQACQLLQSKHPSVYNCL